MDVTLAQAKKCSSTYWTSGRPHRPAIEICFRDKDPRSAQERTLKERSVFAFCLFPITIEDFIAVADANEVLPAKVNLV
ncbi:MAG: hypothetical protein R2825_04035 [Saprospiraceae bacterium]